jgi:hypothetical protein
MVAAVRVELALKLPPAAKVDPPLRGARKRPLAAIREERSCSLEGSPIANQSPGLGEPIFTTWLPARRDPFMQATNERR